MGIAVHQPIDDIEGDTPPRRLSPRGVVIVAVIVAAVVAVLVLRW